MNSKLFVAAALMVTIATPASARAAAGPRMEGVVGWDSLGIERLKADASGVVYGLGVGYDVAVAKGLALGVDAEITDSGAGFKGAESSGGAVLFGRDHYAGVRFTAQASDKIALYAKVGYTNARMTNRIAADGGSVEDSASADGVRAGIGAQYLATSNAYLGAEFRHSNYEDGLSRNQVVATVGWRF